MSDSEVRYGNSLNILRAKAIMVSVAQPQMVTQRAGFSATMPKNQGRVATIRSYDELANVEAGTPEDGQPEEFALTARDVTAPVIELSAAVTLDRSALDFNDDNIPDEISEKLGNQAARSNEIYTLNMLKGGTQVYRSNGVAARSSIATGIRYQDLRAIERRMRTDDVPKINKTIKATDGVSTTSIPWTYLAFVPEIARDNMNQTTLPGFVPYNLYADSDKAFPDEIGAWENIRFLPTNLMPTWLQQGTSTAGFLSNGIAQTAAVDVFSMLIFGKDAYARINLAGSKVFNLKKVLPGSDAAYSQVNKTGKKGYISWWNYQCARIAIEKYMWRYEFAVTGVPA